MDETPYDNEPDWVEMAELWLKRHKNQVGKRQGFDELYVMIEGLIDYIEENI